MRFAIGILIACGLISGAHAQDSVGQRLAASAIDAEHLQGPLDGTWNLIDARGHVLFVLQIGDPVTPGEPLRCAWRDSHGALGVATCQRRGSRLTLTFAAANFSRRLSLRRVNRGVWRGGNHSRGVMMRRP